MRLKKILFPLLLAVCFCSSKSHAMTIVQANLDSVIKGSDFIFEGTVLSDSAFLGSDTNIYTANIIQVTKILKGVSGNGTTLSCGTVEIVTLGGDLSGWGTYFPGSITFHAGMTGIFMCSFTNRPHLTPPSENPSALQMHEDVQGFVQYEQVSETNTLYHWYWYDLPNLTLVYGYIQGLTGYTYTSCDYKKTHHKTEGTGTVVYSFGNEQVTSHGLEFNVYVACPDDPDESTYMDQARVGIKYDNATFGSSAYSNATVTLLGNFNAVNYDAPAIGYVSNSEYNITINSSVSGVVRVHITTSPQKLCHVIMPVTGGCPGLMTGLETDYDGTSIWYDIDSIGSGSYASYDDGTPDDYDGPACPVPVISSFSTSSSPATGGNECLLTIMGSNFGTSRGSQGVFFTDVSNGNSIDAMADDYHYTNWTDNEIDVYVPSECYQITNLKNIPTAATGKFGVGTSSAMTISDDPLTISYSVLNRKTQNIGGSTPIHYWFDYLRELPGSHRMDFRLSSADFSTAPWQEIKCVEMAVWDWVCHTGVNIYYNPTMSPDRDDAGDNINTIFFDVNHIYIGATDKATLAFTQVTYSGCDDNSGYFRAMTKDVDIAIAPPSQQSYCLDPGHNIGCTGTTYDFRSIVEHELGHGIGLQHTLNTGDMMVPNQIEGTQKSLSANDIAGGTYESDQSLESFTNGGCVAYNPLIKITTCPSSPLSAILPTNQSKTNMSVFPNPFNNEIKITFDDATTSVGCFTLSDMEGNVVYSNKSFVPQIDSKIDLGFLPAGVYILKYYSSDNCYTVKMDKLNNQTNIH